MNGNILFRMRCVDIGKSCWELGEIVEVYEDNEAISIEPNGGKKKCRICTKIFSFKEWESRTKSGGSKWELIEEEGEDKVESTKVNFKVKCLDVRVYDRYYTKGKIYEVVDGVFTYDDGDVIRNITSFDDFDTSTFAMWELVEDSSDLRELIEPCYLLVLSDDKKVKTVKTQVGIVVQYTYGGWDKLDTVINEIEKIYGFSTHGAKNDEFSEECRPLIYERISPTQLKLEELEKKQREIADEMEKLRKEL